MKDRSEDTVLSSNRWGEPGKQCEAQPKASRANPQSDRRSLPPRSSKMSAEYLHQLEPVGGPGDAV